jgi:hypothetical protein
MNRPLSFKSDVPAFDESRGSGAKSDIEELRQQWLQKT